MTSLPANARRIGLYAGGTLVFQDRFDPGDLLRLLEAERIDHVLGVPDRTFGEVGHAFVEPKPGKTLDAAALHDWCRERLANYKTPKRFEIRAELPRLPIGKIDKQALKRELVSRDD